MIFVGDDWAEAHHDVVICSEAGEVLVRRRLAVRSALIEFAEIAVSLEGETN